LRYSLTRMRTKTVLDAPAKDSEDDQRQSRIVLDVTNPNLSCVNAEYKRRKEHGQW
jgi:hypothetical protein